MTHREYYEEQAVALFTASGKFSEPDISEMSAELALSRCRRLGVDPDDEIKAIKGE